MADTFKCAVCGKVKAWNRQNASGLFLAEADPPDILVCRDCEPEGERRNQQHTRLHAAAREMLAALQAVEAWAKYEQDWDAAGPDVWPIEKLAAARDTAIPLVRTVLAKVRGEQ